MFANVGWGEMLVLVVAGLVILGPERLPGAIRWTANALRQARDYVSGATSNLREELGPEFDDLREPLSELQKLRGMTPRAALTKHLLDGDDSIFTAMSGLREEQTTAMSGLREEQTTAMSGLREEQTTAMSGLREEQTKPFDRPADIPPAPPTVSGAPATVPDKPAATPFDSDAT
jgi:sec-independent protein translocase protein TatB